MLKKESNSHGGPRKKAGRPTLGDQPLSEVPVTFRPTQRQTDYLGCAAILKIEPAQIIRAALDKWIDEQTGEAG